jgi:hypothetical protein
MLLFGGDFGQLPPVLDKALHSSKKSGSSNTSRIGHLAFNALDTYLLLDQPERQGAHSPLFTALSNLRAGVTTAQDEAFWGSRSLLALRHQQAQHSTEWDLHNPHLLHATCYNRDRDEINHTYVIRAHEVVTVRAVCSGVHATANAHAKGGQALRILRSSYFFTDMLVLLTVNLLPELGLANNTRGIVKAIIYPSGGYDPLDTTQCPILVVEFPGYTGPPWDPAHPTWVPIVSVEKRCDHGCCSRRGLPLWPGKAGSIHSLQGLTAGDGKLFDRIILHWDSKAEGKWPGIFYVGSSRAMAEHNLALAHPLSLKISKKSQAVVHGWPKRLPFLNWSGRRAIFAKLWLNAMIGPGTAPIRGVPSMILHSVYIVSSKPMAPPSPLPTLFPNPPKTRPLRLCDSGTNPSSTSVTHLLTE